MLLIILVDLLGSQTVLFSCHITVGYENSGHLWLLLAQLHKIPKKHGIVFVHTK